MSPRFCTAFCMAVLGLLPAAMTAAPQTPAALPDEIILEFKDGSSPQARAEILATLGALETTVLGRTGALRVRLAGTATQALTRFASHPQLRYIEPNFRVTATAVPNDAFFTQQWALLNTGQTGGTPGADIRATEAWDISTGSADVVVGIIDSGINLVHPDLAANVFTNPDEIAANGIDDDANGFIDDVHGWNFVADNNDAQDDNGHGSAMAGIIGAVGNNGLGIAGVCWNVRLLPIKFLDANGTGSTADAVLGLDYAITMGVRVTNNSWGGGGFSQALFDAITAAHQAGILFVSGVGAQGTNIDLNPTYPASYDVPNVIPVAATDHNDVLYPPSNWGPNTVDLAAPGAGILTTGLGANYLTMSGSSVGVPHVVGALALVFATYPEISGDAAATHLLAHVEPLPSLVGKVRTEGRLDAYAPLAVVPTDVGGNAATETARAALRLWCSSAPGDVVRLEMRLPRDGALSLRIYDVRGHQVRQLLAEHRSAGPYTVLWDGRDDRGGRVARGLYMARLECDADVAVTRIARLH